jgi:23S rRNA (adenine2503-C2)-methyltransferase
MENEKTSITGLGLCELENHLSFLPRFRAKQIHKWTIKGINSFEKMTDIPVSLQEELTKRFCLFSSAVVSCHESDTKKIVIALKDAEKIESVLLCDGKKRYTACLSTQVGCPAKCVFCKTGSLGFKRNLYSNEITEQFLHLYSLGKKIDNIVIMGMGEPLLNLANLRKAINIFNDNNGMNYSKRRITISTCGIADGLFDIAENGPYTRLALSLATADEKLRNKLMPITVDNPLYKIKEALFLFQKNNGGRITLEIPLLGGINTSEKDAKSIADFAKGLDTVTNIIPWNPVENLQFEGKPLCEPEKKEIADFTNMLKKYRLNVTMRLHKGRSIMGACGQLGVRT